MNVRCWVIGCRFLRERRGHMFQKVKMPQPVFPVEDTTIIFTKKIRKKFPMRGAGGRLTAHLVVSKARWVEHEARMRHKK